MKAEKVKPFYTDHGKVVINLSCSESNLNQFEAARLSDLADSGDEKAKRKLERMDKAATYFVEVEQG